MWWGEEGEPAQKSPMTDPGGGWPGDPEEHDHSRYTPGRQLLPVQVLPDYRIPVILFFMQNIGYDRLWQKGKDP